MFLCVCAYVCVVVFFVVVFWGGLQRGEKSYRADSSLELGVVLTTVTNDLFTENVCCGLKLCGIVYLSSYN